MGDVEGMGEALLLAINNNVDVTLPPVRHILRTMHASLGKAKATQNMLKRFGAPLAHGELDELHAVAGRPRGKFGQARHWNAGPSLKLVKHKEQRALTIDRHAAG